MGIFAALLGTPQVYFSGKCRNQIALLLLDMLGKCVAENVWYYNADKAPVSNRIWRRVHERLQRKLGKFKLAAGDCPIDECLNFVAIAEEGEIVSLLTICFEEVLRQSPNHQQMQESEIKLNVYDAGTNLNLIFKENEVPYQWSGYVLVKLDEERDKPNSANAVIPMTRTNEKAEATESEPPTFPHFWLTARILFAISLGSIIAHWIVTHPHYFFWITQDLLYITVSQAITMAIAGVCVLLIVVPHRWDALLATGACLAMGFVAMLLVCRPPSHLVPKEDPQRLSITRRIKKQTEKAIPEVSQPKKIQKLKEMAPLTKPLPAK